MNIDRVSEVQDKVGKLLADRARPPQILSVLTQAVEILDEAGIQYLGMGSLVLGAYAGEEWPQGGEDIDILVYEKDAREAQRLLAQRGFRPDDSGPEWLLKAWKSGVLVDLIHKPTGGLGLDEEMLVRAKRHPINGHTVPVLPPEDFIVMQSYSFSRETVEHWFNAQKVLRQTPHLEWEYLLRRAQARPERVLSLFVFARGEGVPVPEEFVRRLFRGCYGTA